MTKPLVEALRDLQDGAELRWYSDELTAEHPHGTGFVDAWYGNFIAWTITLEPDEDDFTEIYVEPDMMAMVLSDPAKPHEPVFSMVTPAMPPDKLPAEIAVQIGAAHLQTPGGIWDIQPAWSVAVINAAIEDWCRKHADRSVKAVWDMDHGPSPMMLEAAAAVEAIKSGKDGGYMLMPGTREGASGYTMRVSGPVMEQLAQLTITDPDRAKELMASLEQFREGLGDASTTD